MPRTTFALGFAFLMILSIAVLPTGTSAWQAVTDESATIQVGTTSPRGEQMTRTDDASHLVSNPGTSIGQVRRLHTTGSGSIVPYPTLLIVLLMGIGAAMITANVLLRWRLPRAVALRSGAKRRR